MRISVRHLLSINASLHRQSPAKRHRSTSGLPNVIEVTLPYAPKSIQTRLVRKAAPTPAAKMWHKRRPEENSFDVKHGLARIG